MGTAAEQRKQEESRNELTNATHCKVNHNSSCDAAITTITTTSTTTNTKKDLVEILTPTQQQQLLKVAKKEEYEEQQMHGNLPKPSPPPQVIIIPAQQASTVVTNAAKKVRRAFSMPRNPFRWSRKFKTSNSSENNNAGVGGSSSNSAITSCVGGGRGRTGSIVSLNSYEAISKDSNGKIIANDNIENIRNTVKSNIAEHVGVGDIGGINAGAALGGKRVLRRSSFRKFLNRIAHQLSNSINVGGNNTSTSTTTSSINTNKTNFIDIIPYYTGCWRRKEANKHAANTLSQTIAATTNTAPASTSDRVPPICGYQWPADQTPGVMGLKNHGNTCFMNAVLQCLSHTDILAEYFVLDQYKADLKRRNKINSRKFGTKGELTEQLANVLKALWTCKNESDHSTSFKAVVERYGSQFRSSTQHDAQEFLFWLLDKVHEDLNTATKRRYKSVKNNYGRPDEVIAAETLANHIRCNNSFVQAVFQAQFRSSLTCPRCKKQSNTFDPFHCISVQLPQLTQQTIFVTVVYLRQQPHQVKYGLTVPAGSPIVALREQLQIDTGIASERLVLVDLGQEGFTRVFYDSQPVATLNGIETVYCIEMPEFNNNKKAAKTTTTAAAATTTAAAVIKSVGSVIHPSAEENCTNRTAAPTATHATDLLLLVANVRKQKITNSDNVTTVVEDLLGDARSVIGTDSVLGTVTVAVTGAGTGPATPTTTDTATATGTASTIGSGSSGNGKTTKSTFERFGAPFSMQVPRDCSYTELQKKLLRKMSGILKPEVFSYATPLKDMFRIRLQDPSADPDTFIAQVEHPLLTEMIDLALSVLSSESGPPHIKLLLEWSEPDQYFNELSNSIVDHESVVRLRDNKPNDTAALTLEQCLEHYTKAETLSAEDAWRCPHCQQYLPVVKTLGLWSLPDILVVHFKRFRQHHGKGQNAAKLTTMVKFPLTAFDMSPHLARGANGETPATSAEIFRPSTWRKSRPGDSRSSTLSSRADNKETRYDLYAVCYHQGDTLETGHYTAACKNPYDHQWYKFDDQRVTKVLNNAIQEEIINNEAYMLFYQRRTIETTECSGSSSISSDHWISRIAPPTITASAPQLTLDVRKEELVGKVSETEAQHSERVPEKAETKPVDIPKINDDIVEGSPLRASQEVLSKLVVTPHTTSEITKMNGDEFNFVDEDEPQPNINNNPLIVNDVQVEDKLEEKLVDTNQIFVMDEDSATLAQTSAEITVAKNTLPIAAPTEVYCIETSKTNGDHDGNCSITNTTSTNKATSPKSSISQASSSSVSSSATSLSSRSSPHSLAASTFGASTLQTKFNIYALTNNSTSANSYKETVLATNHKSNSSSIIAAASVAARSHEFQLTRNSHHHWHGSRSSVSAVEHATQQSTAHAHGLNLRHSFSTSSNYKFRECNETLSSLLRNSANTCSKDTLLFIDQQNHPSLIEDDDDTFMGSRSLWISPVTPHKLITVSPKN